MATETPPKAELSLQTTLEDYTKASLLAARRNGSLQALPLMVLLSAGLLLLGLYSFHWFSTGYLAVIVPLALCAGCPVVLLGCFWVMPNSVKARAAVHYRTYQELMEPASLMLYADNAVTSSSCLTLTDPYALMAECIETPDLFVLIKDRERMLVIPKRCFPAERAEEITAFLRLVFARRRRLMKNWIF